MKKKITLQAMINKIIKARGKGQPCVGFIHEDRVYLSDNICQITGYSILEAGYNESQLSSLGLTGWGEAKTINTLIDRANSNTNVFEYKGHFPAKVYSDRILIVLGEGSYPTGIDKKYLDTLGENYAQYTYKYGSQSLSIFKDGELEGYIMGVNTEED